MRIIDEPLYRTTAGSLAELLYPGTDKAVESVPARHDQEPRRPNLLRRLVHWISAVRERQATARLLSGMSDHELADIGLGHGQAYDVFEPDFAGPTSIRHRIG